ncbi:MAG: response regulator [Armatimonadetes bacterium]|nr:response regulator [Armatimonadota bacterium]
MIGESIAVSFEPCPTPASVLADAGMMEQVVMNLCVNARDAMPQGGMLRLALAQVTLDGAVLSGHPQSRAGQFIRLEVSDTGCGMDAGTLARLFEPFFTTKGVGQGTGLGLATTHSIVAQHEGWIEVTSEAGRGATFRVWLPQHDAEPVQAATALDDGARGGAAVVLLVEDEEAVRGSTARGLRRMGYEVVEAGDGVEALGVWEREAGRVDLLLTDMVMPAGLNGVELSRRLREQRADLPVVIASGYMAEDRTLPESVTFLSKPFTLAQLGAAVRGALGTTGQGPDEREARRG